MRSVWHRKTKADPLLHGGGLLIGEKCVAHEDKGRPITTWRRPIGEKCVAHEDKSRPTTTWRRPIGEKCVAHEDKGRPITT